jgi:hypothetical protein
MVRPLRLEFPGALYHVTARGDRREAIYLNDPAVERYVRFVQDGVRAASPRETLKHQSILGDETFVTGFRAPDRLVHLNKISKTQRKPLADTLADYRARYPRDEAIARSLSGATR